MKGIAQYIYNYQNTEQRMSQEGGKISAILKDKHLECVSRYPNQRFWWYLIRLIFIRSLLMGLATGVLTFSTLYFGQRRFTSQIKGMKRSTIILSSSFFACTTGRFSKRIMSGEELNLCVFSILDCWRQAHGMLQKSEKKSSERVPIVKQFCFLW